MHLQYCIKLLIGRGVKPTCAKKMLFYRLAGPLTRSFLVFIVMMFKKLGVNFILLTLHYLPIAIKNIIIVLQNMKCRSEDIIL